MRAAFRNPKYEKIALEFSKRNKRCKADELVAAIQERQMLLDHLKKASGGAKKQSDNADVKVKAAKTQRGVCFAFQKGECTRTDCPFLHEKESPRTQLRKLPNLGTRNKLAPTSATDVVETTRGVNANSRASATTATNGTPTECVSQESS